MYIIKHATQEWWMASWTGDPGRTLKKENAKRYKTRVGAKKALTYFKNIYGHIRNMDLVVEDL